MFCLLRGENRSKIRIRRNHYSVLAKRPCEDLLICRRLHLIGPHINCIVPGMREKFLQPRP